MLFLLVLGAGFETTVNLIGNAVVLLDRHPDQRRRCAADPGLWANAVEEVLRFDAETRSLPTWSWSRSRPERWPWSRSGLVT